MKNNDTFTADGSYAQSMRDQCKLIAEALFEARYMPIPGPARRVVDQALGLAPDLLTFLDDDAKVFTRDGEAAAAARVLAQQILGLSESARSRIYHTAGCTKLREVETALKCIITFLTPGRLTAARRRRTDPKQPERRGCFRDGADFIRNGGHAETEADHWARTHDRGERVET